MPSINRRGFMLIIGTAGAAIAAIGIGLDRLLKNNETESHSILETPMPSTRSPLLFASGYAPADQPAIQAFTFDEKIGSLASHGSYTGILNPSFLAIHPNGRWLYAVSETGKNSDGRFGEVWSFRFEHEPFIMDAINHQSTDGDWPCHLCIDKTGKWIVATNYGTGNAAVYPIQEDGSLGAMTDFVQHQGAGPNKERQEGPHAHSSIFTPENRYLIVADLGIDQLVVYSFDSVTGKLGLSSTVHSKPGAGPRHMAFHPAGKWFYAANELDSTVTFYEYDNATGTFAEKQSLATIPAAAPTNIVADIHISGSGRRLYVSNRGHNSIAAFDIQENGSLTLASIGDCGGNWPRNFALAPNGGFILVANQYSNEVCVLPVKDDKEALNDVVERKSVAGACCIQFV